MKFFIVTLSFIVLLHSAYSDEFEERKGVPSRLNSTKPNKGQSHGQNGNHAGGKNPYSTELDESAAPEEDPAELTRGCWHHGRWHHHCPYDAELTNTDTENENPVEETERYHHGHHGHWGHGRYPYRTEEVELESENTVPVEKSPLIASFEIKS